MTRHLRITRRRIPLDQLDEYGRLWRAIRHAAAAAGANAWIFRSEHGSDHFIEFIEWQSERGQTPLRTDALDKALESMDTVFHFEDSNTWQEARI